MTSQLIFQVSSDEEIKSLVEQHQVEGGLTLRAVHETAEGKFAVFGAPTPYHLYDEITDTFIFNIELYLDDVVRPQRDLILDRTDKLMIRDIVDKCTLQELIQLKNWRQALRDITLGITTLNVTWPEKPTVDDSTVQGLLDKINY